jgi:hypothetical protein
LGRTKVFLSKFVVLFTSFTTSQKHLNKFSMSKIMTIYSKMVINRLFISLCQIFLPKIYKQNNKPYLFLKIKVQTLLFGTAIIKLYNIIRFKLGLNIVIFRFFVQSHLWIVDWKIIFNIQNLYKCEIWSISFRLIKIKNKSRVYIRFDCQI